MAAIKATAVASAVNGTTPLIQAASSDTNYNTQPQSQTYTDQHNHSRRASSASGSSGSSESTIPDYATFKRQFITSAAFSVLIASVFVIIPLWLFASRNNWIAFVVGISAYLISDAVRSHFIPFVDLNPRIFQTWLISTAPVALVAFFQETARFGASYLVSQLLQSSKRASRGQAAILLGCGFAFIEVLIRNLGLWQHVKYYRELLATPTHEETARPATLGDHDDIAAFLHTDREDRPEDIVDAVEMMIRHHHVRTLEETLGRKLWDFPAILLAVWSVKTFLLSLALSTIVLASDDDTFALTTPAAFAVASAIHITEVVLWTLLVKTIGLPALTYASFIGNIAILVAISAWYGLIH